MESRPTAVSFGGLPLRYLLGLSHAPPLRYLLGLSHAITLRYLLGSATRPPCGISLGSATRPPRYLLRLSHAPSPCSISLGLAKGRGGDLRNGEWAIKNETVNQLCGRGRHTTIHIYIYIPTYTHTRLKGSLQLRSKRYGNIHFARVPERVLIESFVVLIIGNSRVESLRRTGHL